MNWELRRHDSQAAFTTWLYIHKLVIVTQPPDGGYYITNQRFIIDVSYPFGIVDRVATGGRTNKDRLFKR